ncbi:hypothetical protein [Noviherbaspirillum pedocola]|uniref:Uncharacterized protein n=1 Tax=Noviherbaspirillum pedocola TaxID=2801341 RepID=A0A934W444_9BURK|nr:hypothetical protein [Noviherbaspirillum pedocola]MBK4738116.1 hypothetical protein [Noviherbaspirillum pedocola]
MPDLPEYRATDAGVIVAGVQEQGADIHVSTDNPAPSPVPAPLPRENELYIWFGKTMRTVEEEKQARMQEFSPQIVEKDGFFFHSPGIAENLKFAVVRFLGSVCKLMGKKERSAYDGSCSVASLTRTSITGLNLGYHSADLGIFGLIMTCVYFVTTSVNGALAATRMASLFQSEGENLCWILNNQKELDDVVKKLGAKNEIRVEEAALFNEFMRRKEGISFLKNTGDRMHGSARSAFGRESLGMMPRTIISLLEYIKKVFKVASISSEGLILAQGAAQVIAGPLDINQALADKDIVREKKKQSDNASEYLKKWKKNLDHEKSGQEQKTLNDFEKKKAESEFDLLSSIQQCFNANLQQAEDEWKMTDVRLVRGSILTSSGIALIASNLVLYLQHAHVLHLVGLAITIPVVIAALKILAGVVLAGFLAAACWFAYRGYVAGRKMQEERREANSYLAKEGEKELPQNNRYIALHQLVEKLVEENPTPGLSPSKVSTKEMCTTNFLTELGMRPEHLGSLLIESENQESPEKRIEWLKLNLAPLFGLDYVIETESQPIPVPAEPERKQQPGGLMRYVASVIESPGFGLSSSAFPLLRGA